MRPSRFSLGEAAAVVQQRAGHAELPIGIARVLQDLVDLALDRLGVAHGLTVPATPGWQSGSWRASKYYQEAACFA